METQVIISLKEYRALKDKIKSFKEDGFYYDDKYTCYKIVAKNEKITEVLKEKDILIEEVVKINDIKYEELAKFENMSIIDFIKYKLKK